MCEFDKTIIRLAKLTTPSPRPERKVPPRPKPASERPTRKQRRKAGDLSKPSKNGRHLKCGLD
jgi:hypothetical protein